LSHVVGGPGTWLRRLSPPEDRPAVRLFCFPYAGGGMSVFRSWPALLPGGIEVYAVQLPGREDRLFEPVVTDLMTVVATVAEEIARQFTGRVALFGHSLGAVMAWEVASRLEHTGRPPVDQVFVSGCRALPVIHEGRRDLHDLPEHELVGELRRMNGTPEEILTNPELLRLLLPAVRADYEMLSGYRYAPGRPPASALTVFGGASDPAVPLEYLYRWQDLAAGPVTVDILPGDHFFLHSARAELLRELARRLDPATRSDRTVLGMP
jgi:medium-chain acyl-[acyl-carrier-protein] hydrolase